VAVEVVIIVAPEVRVLRIVTDKINFTQLQSYAILHFVVTF